MTAVRHALAALALALVAATPVAAQVMPDVMGTEKSARKMLSEMKTFVKNNSVDALVKNLGQKGTKFGGSKHHLAVLSVREGNRIFVERHNHYKALTGVDFTNQTDLNGKKYIKSFYKNAKNGGGTTTLLLEVPAAEEAKKSWCINQWAPGHKGEVFLTACY